MPCNPWVHPVWCPHVGVRRTWGVGKSWHRVRKILNMVTIDGKRWWLVAWEGRDEHNDLFDDSWEPTANVAKELRDEWFAECAARVQRSIQVDVRPLDTLIQRTISTGIIKDTVDTFGKVHVCEIGALTLYDLAHWYLSSVAERFQLQRKSAFGLGGASDRVTVDELRIKDPEQVGEFCKVWRSERLRSRGGLLVFMLIFAGRPRFQPMRNGLPTMLQQYQVLCPLKPHLPSKISVLCGIDARRRPVDLPVSLRILG